MRYDPPEGDKDSSPPPRRSVKSLNPFNKRKESVGSDDGKESTCTSSSDGSSFVRPSIADRMRATHNNGDGDELNFPRSPDAAEEQRRGQRPQEKASSGRGAPQSAMEEAYNDYDDEYAHHPESGVSSPRGDDRHGDRRRGISRDRRRSNGSQSPIQTAPLSRASTGPSAAPVSPPSHASNSAPDLYRRSHTAPLDRIEETGGGSGANRDRHHRSQSAHSGSDHLSPRASPPPPPSRNTASFIYGQAEDGQSVMPSTGRSKQFMTIFMYPGPDGRGFTFLVEGGGREKRFVKLANALTFAAHYGYVAREFDAERSFHEMYMRVTGRDESNLFIILSKNGVNAAGGGASGGASVSGKKLPLDRVPSNVSMGSFGSRNGAVGDVGGRNGMDA